MTDEQSQDGTRDADWPANYFNYFTEIEEHFQRARGTSLFLLSPLDWALIENWKSSGVPLEAVLKGIDEAFEKWRSRKVKRRAINSVAYCAQAVAEAAQRAPTKAARSSTAAPFTIVELQGHLRKALEAFEAQTGSGLPSVADSLRALLIHVEKEPLDFEDLERRLAALEDRTAAVLRATQSEQSLYEIRCALDEELRPYRGKMSAEQLAMLERRYFDTVLWERAGLPRLSLFYLHPI